METPQDLFKDEAKEKELSDLLDEVKSKRDQIKSLDASLKEMKSEKERLVEQAISMMGQLGMASIRKEGGSLFSITTKKEYPVTPENRGLQREWCKENHLEEMLSVNYQSWNSLMKETENVPEFTEVFEKKTISIRG